ncbi:WD repeat-containing protein 78-like protein [Corchorus olitorius]|uniref:WD repeat-containing protein 78-like protein n=1 Tax=Corchorus olitorius TaxID=93759 RepID=A0A1R3KTK7_9ROSI|nr:WD repeat-containing protein 78-like protein [Corchorus olitorius]
MNNGCKRKAPAGSKAPTGQNRKYIRLHNISRYLNPSSTHPSPTITPPSTYPSSTITPSSSSHSPTITPPSTHPSPTITPSPTPPSPTHPTPTNISPTAPIGHQEVNGVQGTSDAVPTSNRNVRGQNGGFKTPSNPADRKEIAILDNVYTRKEFSQQLQILLRPITVDDGPHGRMFLSKTVTLIGKLF